MATIEVLNWKMQWAVIKWRDPEDKVAKALQQGMSIKEARRVFPDSYIRTEKMKPDCGEVKLHVKPVLGKQRRVALNEGLQELIDIICGLGTPIKWDASNARLGVGNSNTAADPSQTGLLGANKAFKGMDTGYPAMSSQTAEWRATFGTSEANFAWEEYTVVNAADDSGKNLNRKVESKGTKVSGETWTLSLKITFS